MRRMGDRVPGGGRQSCRRSELDVSRRDRRSRRSGPRKYPLNSDLCCNNRSLGSGLRGRVLSPEAQTGRKSCAPESSNPTCYCSPLIVMKTLPALSQMRIATGPAVIPCTHALSSSICFRQRIQLQGMRSAHPNFSLSSSQRIFPVIAASLCPADTATAPCIIPNSVSSPYTSDPL